MDFEIVTHIHAYKHTYGLHYIKSLHYTHTCIYTYIALRFFSVPETSSGIYFLLTSIVQIMKHMYVAYFPSLVILKSLTYYCLEFYRERESTSNYEAVQIRRSVHFY
jgi:hypothetical protein